MNHGQEKDNTETENKEGTGQSVYLLKKVPSLLSSYFFSNLHVFVLFWISLCALAPLR